MSMQKKSSLTQLAPRASQLRHSGTKGGGGTGSTQEPACLPLVCTHHDTAEGLAGTVIFPFGSQLAQVLIF